MWITTILEHVSQADYVSGGRGPIKQYEQDKTIENNKRNLSDENDENTQNPQKTQTMERKEEIEEEEEDEEENEDEEEDEESNTDDDSSAEKKILNSTPIPQQNFFSSHNVTDTQTMVSTRNT